MKSKAFSTRFLCMTGIMAALVCIMTIVIQIPIPLGYANLGNAFILLTVLLVGKRSGFWAGGIGSAMADLLTGYAYWAIPTFLIKSLMAYLVGKIAYNKDGTCSLYSVRFLIACAVGMTWMVMGYTVVGAMLYGSWEAGIASMPGLAIEGVLNLVVFYGVGTLFEKSKVGPMLSADRKGNA